MPHPDSLQPYRDRRSADRTPEPAGRLTPVPGSRIFVVQKHDATNLHWDFRLELDGVLKSWAVPKGPSTDPRDKRLAVTTEDHPLAYRNFEGTIPEGEYGAGTVLVWDRGTYRVLTERDDRAADPETAIEKGHIAVWLDGEKLKGGYALTRTRGRGEKSQWLLVKMRDEEADARRNPVSTQPESVISGRTLEEIAEEEG